MKRFFNDAVDHIDDTGNGTARRSAAGAYRKANLWGFADADRKIIIAPAYEKPIFSEGFAAVKKGGKWGTSIKQAKW